MITKDLTKKKDSGVKAKSASWRIVGSWLVNPQTRRRDKRDSL